MDSETNEDPDEQKDRIVEESPKGRFLRVRTIKQSKWRDSKANKS